MPSRPPKAYALLPGQVILTASGAGGPVPGIYAAEDFIRCWRAWDGEKPLRAWRTLFWAADIGGERFDFYLLEDGLQTLGERLFPDPSERLFWQARTALGLDRLEEAQMLAAQLEASAVKPADRQAAVRLRGLLAAARAAGRELKAEEKPAAALALWRAGLESDAEQLIAGTWREVFRALFAVDPDQESLAAGWRRALLAIGAECLAQLSPQGFHLRLWRAAARIDRGEIADGLAEVFALFGCAEGESEKLELLAFLAACLEGGQEDALLGRGEDWLMETLAVLSSEELEGSAVLPQRESADPARLPGTALPASGSLPACRAEVRRFLRIRELLRKGDLLFLEALLARPPYPERTLFEEMLLRLLGAALVPALEPAARAARQERLGRRLCWLGGGLPQAAEAVRQAAAHFFACGGDAEAQEINETSSKKARSETEEALHTVLQHLSGLLTRGGCLAEDGRREPRKPLALSFCAALALLLSEAQAAPEPREEEGSAVIEVRTFGGSIRPGRYPSDRLLRLWRRESDPAELSPEFLAQVIRAAECTFPKSADMRLLKRVFERHPELFGGVLERHLWRAHIACGFSHWREALEAVFDFMSEWLAGNELLEGREELLRWASLAAARAEAGRLLAARGVILECGMSQEDRELVASRLARSPLKEDQALAQRLRADDPAC